MGFSLTPEAVSWSQVDVTIADLVLSLPTIKKIEYGSKNNTVAVYGAGKKMYDKTDGIIEVDDVKLEIGLADWAILYNQLVIFGQSQPENIAAGVIFNGANGMDVIYAHGTQFSISISYSLLKNFVNFNDTLSNCRIKNVSMSPAQGPDPVMVSIDLDCQDVQRSTI